ncbi:MAG: hypothetical protein CM15mV18_0040 [uncultured marine virus]|nr:MAG: hypothetical protein CM15mV18_0040 [uncultured marine virus]
MAKITTRKMKAMKLKKALKKEFSSKRQYKTTYKDIKKYFKILNNVIFDSKLSPFGQIQIKDLKREKCIGQVVTFEWKRKGTRLYKLEMLPHILIKRFYDTLVHEMTHLYQMQNLSDTKITMTVLVV